MEPGSGITRARLLLQLAMLIFSLLLMAWEAWQVVLTEQQRTATRLRLLRLSSRVTRALGRRTGAACMGRELATGCEQYEVPLWLGRQADRLDKAADSMRAGLS